MASSLFPFKTGIVVGVLCFVVVRNPPFSVNWPTDEDFSKKRVEFYPLSAFPMYSEFSDAPFYCFVTDDRDQPLALETGLKTAASALKKDYEKELKDRKTGKGKITELPLEVKQAAGTAALRNLVTNVARPWFEQHPDQVVRLYEGIIRRTEGKVEESTLRVAEGSFNTLSKEASGNGGAN